MCECSALGMPWGTAKSNAASAVCSRYGRACTGCCDRAGQVVCGVAVVVPFSGVFQSSRCRSATTVYRALPVCGWPALSMPWGTASSNAGSAECNRCGVACTGCCGRVGQVVYGGCGFGASWSFSGEGAPLGNHCAQSTASMGVASPGHAIGHCKFKHSFGRLIQ